MNFTHISTGEKHGRHIIVRKQQISKPNSKISSDENDDKNGISTEDIATVLKEATDENKFELLDEGGDVSVEKNNINPTEKQWTAPKTENMCPLCQKEVSRANLELHKMRCGARDTVHRPAPSGNEGGARSKTKKIDHTK